MVPKSSLKWELANCSSFTSPFKHTEVNDEEPDHNNRRPASSLVSSPVIFEGARNASNDQVTACHADRTNNEHRFSSELVDIHDCGNRRLAMIVKFSTRLKLS